MMLAGLLDRERVRTLEGVRDRDALLESLATLLGGNERCEHILQALRQRERMGGTGIGHGVAIPHGRSDVIKEARAVFVRLQPAVDFDASDGEAVDLVVALAVPASFTHQHLQWLSEIAERFSQAEFRNALREAASDDALHALLIGRNAP